MIIECTGNKLLGAEGSASEDKFIKVFNEEIKKRLEGGNKCLIKHMLATTDFRLIFINRPMIVPDIKSRSRANGANSSTKVSGTEKRNKSSVKATTRRRFKMRLK